MPERSHATLDALPRELRLEVASSLDPLEPQAVQALVSLIDMGLVDAEDLEELHIRRHGRPFPWAWLVGWSEHFIATFIERTDRSTPFTEWLDKLLIEACRRGQNDVIELLVARGVQPSSDHLITAASAGMNETLDLLVTYGLHPDATSDVSSWSPLLAACMYGQASTVIHLIKTYKVDYRRQTASGEYLIRQLARRHGENLTDVVSQFLDAP